MSNEIAPLQGIADKVKERIKAQFADLIPDEVYEAMVQTATQEFIKVDAPMIIKNELKTHLLGLVQTELKKPEYNDKWSYGAGGMSMNIGSELVQRVIKEHSADLVAGMFSGLMQQMLNNLRNQPRY
jgi:replicative superfamily II helicase